MTIGVNGKRSEEASPCIGLCTTALGDETCRGCGRSFEEVNNWHSLKKKKIDPDPAPAFY